MLFSDDKNSVMSFTQLAAGLVHSVKDLAKIAHGDLKKSDKEIE